MQYLLIISLLNNMLWAMEYHHFSDIDSFLYHIDANKENCHNNLPYENASCSLKINDLDNLRKFYELPAPCLEAIYSINIPTINASSAEEQAFIKFFKDHHSYFTKLTIFISSGLRLGDNFTEILNKIPSLTQVDLIGARLSNRGLLNLLNMDVGHINVYNNPMISDEVVPHILSMDKTFNNVILVIKLSIDKNIEDQLHNRGINLMIF